MTDDSWMGTSFLRLLIVHDSDSFTGRFDPEGYDRFEPDVSCCFPPVGSLAEVSWLTQGSFAEVRLSSSTSIVSLTTAVAVSLFDVFKVRLSRS